MIKHSPSNQIDIFRAVFCILKHSALTQAIAHIEGERGERHLVPVHSLHVYQSWSFPWGHAQLKMRLGLITKQVHSSTTKKNYKILMCGVFLNYRKLQHP